MAPFDLRDTFETVDGSRPQGKGLDDEIASRHPLSAMQLLIGGDVFERIGGKAPDDGEAKVRAWWNGHVTCFGAGEFASRLVGDAVTLLHANPVLLTRLEQAKPLEVHVVAPGSKAQRSGFPRQMAHRAAGLFWDQPDWPAARVLLRSDQLRVKPALVAHELCHAVHYLALTKAERELSYGPLRRTFGSRAAMDEVFAIYGEIEFLRQRGAENSTEGPGIYGVIRRQWNDRHVFTRFIRKLFYPHLGGPRVG